MSDIEIKIQIKTSEKFGDEFCDPECPHITTYLKFPPIAICKFSPGLEIHPDQQGRLPRNTACKYLAGEEVEDRFWSPLKGS